jgi:hypothetical protein
MGANLRQHAVKIDYKVQPDKFGAHIYSAMLNVQLALPVPNAPRTKRFEAIIDSGASRCMFHADIGRHLGLDIRKGDYERTQGIGGSADCWVHRIRLYIFGEPHEIHAAFKEALPVAGLLGMNGFFDHFLVTFVHPTLTCDIERIVQNQS